MDIKKRQFKVNVEERSIEINNSVKFSDLINLSNIMANHERTLDDFPNKNILWDISIINYQ